MHKLRDLLQPCFHLGVSLEAYGTDSLDEDAERHTITVHLCDWPDNLPDRLADAPTWLAKLVGPGLAIDPHKDCAGCPAYTPRNPTCLPKPSDE